MLMLSTLVISVASILNPGGHEAQLLHGEPAPRAADRTGTSVASAGDVDADGVSDWILGAPRAQVGGSNVGRAWVLSGADFSVLHQWLGGPGPDGLGACVAAAGDVNQDGHGDLLVGAPYGSGGRGELRLYSGADGTLLHQWVGSNGGDRFGHCASSLGDLDGDGVPDLAVGAPFSDTGGHNAGELSVFSGAAGGLLASLSGGPFDQLGFSVAGAGDLNGDGYLDFAVGIPFADGGAFNAGAVRALSGLDFSLLFESQGNAAGDQLGFGLDAGLDVNGDAVPDLVCAAPAADANGIDSGAAVVLSGQDGSVLHTLPGPGDSKYLTAVALIEDLDGDGLAEVLGGAAAGGAHQAGQVEVFSGASGASLQVFRGPRAWGWFGAALAAGGDSNGDGLGDIIVGAPGHDDHQEIFGWVEILTPR